MKKITFIYLFILLVQSSLFAQDINLSTVKFKNIGPTVMSGRVVDVAVNPENPIEFYVAYASGGLWYTNNNGTSFEPIMDNAPTLNCGAVTVDWNTKTIWIGTGEVNSSRSSYAGIGVLKSTNQGKTWENIGLTDSHHISRIWVNPKNNNEIVVGVLGYLYTPNAERGIFKTFDGGKTWQKTLFVNQDTGVIDIAVVSNNPKIMFASTWERERKAWDFKGNGKGSGIYKSEDAGTTWKLMSTSESGFPNNEGVGRIGLASFDANIIYAVVDNQNKRPLTEKEKEKPKDANAALFETEVIGCEVYVSNDAGKTWSRTHKDFIDDMYYSYGYYFGVLSVDQTNSNRIYLSGVPLIFSEDGGKTFTSLSKDNVHADHHVVWINPKNPNHIINGNDGGINITYDNGKNWIKCNNEAVGQFYSVNVDNAENYNVFGGLQDNGVWVANSNYEASPYWHQSGQYPYQSIMGGDGMQVQIDARNNNIVYTGFQFGNYYKIDRTADKQDFISPKAKKEEEPLRYNWQTPILLSNFNQDVLYMGSQFLHRSMNQGKDWEKISTDLTKGKVEGNVAFGTITCIDESKFQFGLLYAGSDDGLVHVSKDGGTTWQKISDNLPQDRWVSRIKASKFKKERVYVTLNGYRNDDFKSYVYVSEDYGTTWTEITSGLPVSPVNVLIEDYKNENLLFVGIDNGLYVSMNTGATWQDFSEEIPNVAVHDLVIQEKAADLIVGTHGRSLYKANIEALQNLDTKIREKQLHVFPVSDVKQFKMWGNSWSKWSDTFEPKQVIQFYSNSNEKVQIAITNENGMEVAANSMEAIAGLNEWNYDFTTSEAFVTKWNKKNKENSITVSKNLKYYLPKSKYTITVTKGETIEKIPFEIK